jgi:hypothetical protein
MIAKKGEFYSGAGMMAVFVVVLIVIFMPVFNGHNGLDYLDSLYNSISKGSAYYIPAMQEEAKTYAGNNVKLTLAMQDETQARQTSLLFQKGGALVNVSGAALSLDGDLGALCPTSMDTKNGRSSTTGGRRVMPWRRNSSARNSSRPLR